MAILATPAPATVAFDWGSGAGFSGRGDVSGALGLKPRQMDAALDTNLAGFSFFARFSDVYNVTCYWEEEVGRPGSGRTVTHTSTVPRTYGIHVPSLAYDIKKSKNVSSTTVSGFNLPGWNLGDVTYGDVPEIGDPCSQGEVISVDWQSSSGGLYARYQGTTPTEGLLIPYNGDPNFLG